MLLFPWVAPCEPAGLVKTLWSVKVKEAAPKPASVETPTYTVRCGPLLAFSVALSGAVKATYRLPLLGQAVLSTLSCAAVLAVLVGDTLPAAGSVAASMASPKPAV